MNAAYPDGSIWRRRQTSLPAGPAPALPASGQIPQVWFEEPVHQRKQDDAQEDGNQHVRGHARDGYPKGGSGRGGMLRVRDHHGENGQPHSQRIAFEVRDRGGMGNEGESKSPEQTYEMPADDIRGCAVT